MGPLTLLTFIPAVGAAVVALLPSGNHKLIRWTTLGITAIVLVIACSLYPQFNSAQVGINQESSFQFVEKADWIPAYGIGYFVGVDGLSFPMVLLTALLCFLCIPASWGIKTAVKGYMSLFLLLETGMMGTFVSLDFFLFYVFWEIMLLPMYFLIGIWGGPRRVYAAIKFFLYTLLGSVLLLLVMLVLYFNVKDPVTGGHTFNMLHMMAQGNHVGILALNSVRILLFFGLFIGFAIKVPVFPFHTWLPDAHVEAPTAISVILAGVLLKMGTYGILRFSYPILPDITRDFAWFLALFGMINIIYGALCAMAQKDLKKLVAYSSISHMGYVLLAMSALTPAGMNGAVMQMFSHGIITAMLFLLVGVIYDRAHHREINGFGGLANVMPKYMGDHGDRLLRLHGPAGPVGLHRRSAVLHRRLPRLARLHDHRHRRDHHHGGLSAVDAAARLLRGDQSQVRGPARHQCAGTGDAAAAGGDRHRHRHLAASRAGPDE